MIKVLDSTLFFFDERCKKNAIGVGFILWKLSVACITRETCNIWVLPFGMLQLSCAVVSVSCSRVFQLIGRSFMAGCAWVCYCTAATERPFLVVLCLSACLAGVLMKSLPSTTIGLPWNIIGTGTAREMLNSVPFFSDYSNELVA